MRLMVLNYRVSIIVVVILILFLYVPRQSTPDEIVFHQAVEHAHSTLGSAFEILREAVNNATDFLNNKTDHALFALKLHGQFPGWLQRSPDWIEPCNYTDLFWKYYNESMVKPAIQELESAHISVHFVGGIFTDYYPRYLVGNLQYLNTMAKLLPNVRVIGINSVATVEDNARVIRDAVLQEALTQNFSRRIVLIGHSKGGVDITAAIALYPELHSLVHCVILMQTPYAGSLILTGMIL